MAQTLVISTSLAQAHGPHSADGKDAAAPQPADPSTPPTPAFDRALKDQTQKIKMPTLPQAAAKTKPAASAGDTAGPANAETNAGAAPQPLAAPHKTATSDSSDRKSSSADTSKDVSQPELTQSPSLDPAHLQSLAKYVSQAQEPQADTPATTATAPASPPSAQDVLPGTSGLAPDANGKPDSSDTGDSPQAATTPNAGATPQANATPGGDNTSPTLTKAAPAAPDPTPLASNPPGAEPDLSPKSAAVLQTPPASNGSALNITSKAPSNSQPGAPPNTSDQQSAQQNPSFQTPAQTRSAASRDMQNQSASSSDLSNANPQTIASTTDATPALAASIATVALPDSPASSTAAKIAPPAPPLQSPLIAGTAAAPQAPTSSATSAASAQQSPASSGDNVLDQVVLGLHAKFDAQNGKAEIRLDPPNLGTLRVSIALNKGTLTAQFETSTDSVRDLLSNHIDKLRSALESQGITVDRLAVQTQAPQQASSQTGAQSSAGSSNHDGRSAGGYEQNRRGTQRDSTDQTFARTFQQARNTPVPVDLLA